MTSIPGVNSTASLILQQLNSTAPAPQGENNSVNVAAIANGLNIKAGPETHAQAKINDTLSATSLTQARMQLYKRVGEELGVKEEDYTTPQQWAAALRGVVRSIRAQKGGDAVILEIEQKLGLDKLGVSLDTVIDSIADPNGGASKALNDALKKAAGKGLIAIGNGDTGLNGAVQLNEIGMYRLAKA